MTPFQLGIIFGTRLILLIGAVGIFVVGVVVKGTVGNVLVGVAIVVLVIYFVVQFRTGRAIQAALKKSEEDVAS